MRLAEVREGAPSRIVGLGVDQMTKTTKKNVDDWRMSK
jgi:hypothetical protein